MDKIIEFNLCLLDLNLNKFSVENNKITKQILKFILNMIKNKYDVICLHGFQNKIIYNDIQNELWQEYKNNSNLYFYPKLPHITDPRKQAQYNKENIVMPNESSVSLENDAEIHDLNQIYDTMIISRHFIDTNASENIPMGTCSKKLTWYIINIIFHGIVISIFNVKFQTDFIGISNRKVREEQIQTLNKTIFFNKSHVKNDLQYDKNISIISLQSGINNFKNNCLNMEYEYMLNSLKCIDTYNYVSKLKKGLCTNISDIFNIQSNYILLHRLFDNTLDNNLDIMLDDIKLQDIGIINSYIDTKYNIYNSYPLITKFGIIQQSNVPYGIDETIEI